MADWKDNKNLGPWDFVERGSKFGYLNNPNWTDQQDSINFSENLGYSIDSPTHHSPCGHWHKAKWYDIVGGKWVAAMQQLGTPYIYLYNVPDRQVIRIDTSETPPIVDNVLRLTPMYDLNYDMGYGTPGAQRGGYCMNSAGTKIWYLFIESTGTRTNAELIEVSITSYYMRKVKSTIFPDLMSPGEQITDGCASNTHIYWSTSLTAGRIIKIDTSDHSIIDDHYFNYPIEGCSTFHYDECIATICASPNGTKLYWVYGRDHTHCIPAYNACQHIIEADFNLLQISDTVSCSTGVSTPAWNNLIRYINRYILEHHAYHPSYGPLTKYNLDILVEDFIYVEYLQNILGIIGGDLYTFMHMNNLGLTTYLYQINFDDMTEVSRLDVSHYTGHIYSSTLDWDRSSVSVMNTQTKRILLFRYNNVARRNYAAVFNAAEEFPLVCDAMFNRYYDDPTRGPFGEPQIWPIKE